MNSMIYLTFICTIFLLFLCENIHANPVSLDFDHKWETGYHPFPEMSRFLNSHSRVHRPSLSRPTYSFLGYLCSITTNDEKIEEILNTFGKKYRSLITKIIEKECSINQKHKRTTINIKHKNFPRTFLRNIIDYYENI